MANTRKSTKRARQSETKRQQNQRIRSSTQKTLKAAIDVIKSKKDTNAAATYAAAVRALSKAASKGALPKGRAARKISRLTLLAKKALPAALQTPKT